MDEPSFLHRVVTDQELAADLDALRAGRYPRWRFVGDSTWQSTQVTDGCFVLGHFRSIWLTDHLGAAITIVLRQDRTRSSWRRGEPGESALE